MAKVNHAWQAVNRPRVQGPRATLEDLDAESSTEMRALVERREEEASKRGLWSARESAMTLIRCVMHKGGLGLGNLHAMVGDYGNAGGIAGWLIELRWWQLNGMRPAQFSYSVALRDEHEFSHAVRAVAAALLVRAMGSFAFHREQWRGGR